MFLQTHTHTHTQPTDNSSPDKYVYSQANIIFVIPSISPCKDWMNISRSARFSSHTIPLSLWFITAEGRRVGGGLWRENEARCDVGCKKVNKQEIDGGLPRERKRDGEVADKVRKRWRECARAVQQRGRQRKRERDWDSLSNPL